MDIKNSVALVTGTNRGVGRAIVQALVAIRQAAAGSPHGADAAAVAAIDASIDIARSAPPDTVAEAWQLHHWSPYVLHGAPRVR